MPSRMLHKSHCINHTASHLHLSFLAGSSDPNAPQFTLPDSRSEQESESGMEEHRGIHICTSEIRSIRVSALVFQVYIATSVLKFTYLLFCFCPLQGLEPSVFSL